MNLRGCEPPEPGNGLSLAPAPCQLGLQSLNELLKKDKRRKLKKIWKRTMKVMADLKIRAGKGESREIRLVGSHTATRS